MSNNVQHNGHQGRRKVPASTESDPLPQRIEQAIATTFTCRSVIKYTSSLNEEQKNELLADIDTMLKFLRDRSLVPSVPADASMNSYPASSAAQRQQAEVHSSNVGADKGAEKDGEGDDKMFKQRLSEIYRVVELYLSTKNDDGTSEFMTGFRAAMAALDDVQVIAMQNRYAGFNADSQHVEDLLEKVRTSISDVYLLYTEFARTICNALEGSGIYIDTEELSSIALERSMSKVRRKPTRGAPDFSLLLKVYETHLQLNEKKGTIASRIDDATAFLIFLMENLGIDVDKRDTVIVQLNKIARLLDDLSNLLSKYESSVSVLLGHE
jgi:hypothetical protein